MTIKPFFKDVIITFAAQFAILFSFFIVYKIVASDFGAAGVGEYSLVKRLAGFLTPLFFLGLGVGLPRYVAMSSGAKRGEYLKIGAYITAGLTAVFLLVANTFPDFFSAVFFGSKAYSNYIVPVSFFLAGLNIYSLVYAYLQGRLLAKKFNILQFFALAAVPIVVLLFFNSALPQAVALIGILTIIVSLAFVPYAVRDLSAAGFGRFRKEAAKELMKYSIARFPGDFLLSGILTLSPIFAAHFVSVEHVGYLSIGQSLMPAIGGLAAPLGIILLPKISNLLSRDRNETIAKSVDIYVAAILQCSVFGCVQLAIFSDTLIGFWLGREFAAAAGIVRASIFAAFFYLFYVSTRSIIDAVKVKALNTINLLISFCVLILASAFIFPLGKIVDPLVIFNGAFVASTICLAALTYFSLRRLYPCGFKEELRNFLPALSISIGFAIISLAAKPYLSGIFALAAYELLIGAIYLAVLYYLKSRWIKEAFGLAFKKNRETC